MRRLAALSLLVLFGAGCASSGQTEIGDSKQLITTTRINIGDFSRSVDIRAIEDFTPREDTVAASPDLVWGLLPSVYQELNVPFTALNPEARVLGANRSPVRGDLGNEPASRYFHCGRTMTGDIADQYQLVVTAMSQVQEVEGEEDAARVVTLLDAFARPKGASSNSVRCSSTHRLEGQIVDAIELELAQTGNLGR